MSQIKQKTLKEAFKFNGIGLHTGKDIHMTFHPAPENHGIKIQRVDLEGSPIISALAENVTNTQRGTVLSKGTALVSTVEHAMAALYALGVEWNRTIPATSGSAPTMAYHVLIRKRSTSIIILQTTAC